MDIPIIQTRLGTLSAESPMPSHPQLIFPLTILWASKMPGRKRLNILPKRFSVPLCLVTSGVGEFHSLAPLPDHY